MKDMNDIFGLLEKKHDEYHLQKKFDTYISDAVEEIEYRLFHDWVCESVVRVSKERFPLYPCTIRKMGDGGEEILFFKVEDNNSPLVRECIQSLIRTLDPEGKIDLLVSTKNPRVTEENYPYMVDKIQGVP